MPTKNTNRSTQLDFVEALAVCVRERKARAHLLIRPNQRENLFALHLEFFLFSFSVRRRFVSSF